MTPKETAIRKLGANRNDPARKQRRPRSPSESRDLREDRGERQSKLGHPSHTVPASPLPQPVLPLRACTPRLLSEHASPSNPASTHLRLVRAGAGDVCVAGSFNGWKPERLMRHAGEADAWEIELSLAPGEYEYRFIVDGEWTDDPNAAAAAPNPFGSMNAVLRVV